MGFASDGGELASRQGDAAGATNRPCSGPLGSQDDEVDDDDDDDIIIISIRRIIHLPPYKL